MDLLVDSGSTTLAIPLATCSAANGCPNFLNRFVAGPQTVVTTNGMLFLSRSVETSPTFWESAAVSGRYGDGSRWTGFEIQDMASFGGGAPSVPVTFAGIATATGFFNVVDQPCNHYTAHVFDGIIGMAFPQLAMGNTTSILHSTLRAMFPENSGLLDATGRMFAHQLCSKNGKLWIGGVDDSFMLASPPTLNSAMPRIAWINVTRELYWDTKVVDVSVNGVSIGLATEQFDRLSIFDSGTTLTSIPQAVFNAVARTIRQSQVWRDAFGVVDLADPFGSLNSCPSASSTYDESELDQLLPTISFTLHAHPSQASAWSNYSSSASTLPTSPRGSVQYNSSTGTVTFTLPPINGYLLVRKFTDSFTGRHTSYYCSGLGYHPDFDEFIFGWTTLTHFITIYDIANDRIGLSPTTSCSNPGVGTWSISEWSSCDIYCTQHRSVQCLGSNGDRLDDGNCGNDESPTAVQPCALQGCVVGRGISVAPNTSSLPLGKTLFSVLMALIAAIVLIIVMMYVFRHRIKLCTDHLFPTDARVEAAEQAQLDADERAHAMPPTLIVHQLEDGTHIIVEQPQEPMQQSSPTAGGDRASSPFFSEKSTSSVDIRIVSPPPNPFAPTPHEHDDDDSESISRATDSQDYFIRPPPQLHFSYHFDDNGDLVAYYDPSASAATFHPDVEWS